MEPTTDAVMGDTGNDEYDEVEELDFECSSDEEDWGDGSTERGKTPEAEEEEEETDPKRLMQRQKQIDFGKNTKGYERYVQAVPKKLRKKRGTDQDPPTPDIKKKMGKRAWDGVLHSWRRHLHKYDDMDEATAKANAKALKEKVVERRAARAKELGLEVTNTEPTKLAAKRDKDRRKRLAILSRQQRKDRKERREQQAQEATPASEAPQQEQTGDASQQQQQQLLPQVQQQEAPEFEVYIDKSRYSSREWGSAERHSGRSRPYGTDGGRGYGSSTGRDRERERERHETGSYSRDGDRDGDREGDRRQYGSSRNSRDRGYDRSSLDYSREGGRGDRGGDYGSRQVYPGRGNGDWRSDERSSKRHSASDSRREPQQQSSRWQRVDDSSRREAEKEDRWDRRGQASTGRDDDSGFHDKPYSSSHSSRFSKPDPAAAAAAAAATAAIAGSKGGFQFREPSSRRYSSLSKGWDGSSHKDRGQARDQSPQQDDAMDGDAANDDPSPVRRQPVRLGIADLMELDAMTPGSAGNPKRKQQRCSQLGAPPTPISWADQVEAADALFEGCDRYLQSMQEDGDDGEVVGPLDLAAGSPPGRAATQPGSARVTPAKRAASCLG